MLLNILRILRGSVTAQVVGFFALPLLTRYYSPEAFGLFQLFQVVMGLLLMTTSMRYEIALLKARDGRELSVMLLLCGLINLGISFALVVGCCLAYWGPFNLSAQTSALLWWLPVGVLVGGGLQTLGYLALRDKAFTLIARSKVAQALSAILTSIGIGFYINMPTGLVIGDLVGRLISGGLIIRLKSISLPFPCRISELKAAALRFREYPLVSVPGGLINVAGGMLTSLMMFTAFDASTAGQYGLVERSIMLPVAMVAGAVSQVFTADLADRLRDGRINALILYRSVMRRMFFLGLVPAIMVGVGAPKLFGLLFGPDWTIAGEFARIMSPLIVVVLVTTSVNMAVVIAGYQKIQFLWEVMRLLIMLLSWLAIINFSIPVLWAIAIHVLAVTLASIVYLILADHMLGCAS